MDLIYLGYSSVRLQSGGVTVITDPFPGMGKMRSDERNATVVTVSNIQANHASAGLVSGSPKVFRTPGEYEYNGIVARGVMTHLPAGVPHEQRNVAYTVVMDNVNVCHLGNPVKPLTTKQIDELKPVDVLLVPTGGQCAISLDHAIQTIQDIDPRVVIPLHFAHDKSDRLSNVDLFLRKLGHDEVKAQPRMSISKGNIPSELRVNILSPRQ